MDASMKPNKVTQLRDRKAWRNWEWLCGEKGENGKPLFFPPKFSSFPPISTTLNFIYVNSISFFTLVQGEGILHSASREGVMLEKQDLGATLIPLTLAEDPFR